MLMKTLEGTMLQHVETECRKQKSGVRNIKLATSIALGITLMGGVFSGS